MRAAVIAVLLAACKVSSHTYTKAPDDAAPDATPDAPLPAATLRIQQPAGDLVIGDVIVNTTSSATTFVISNDGGQPSGALAVTLDDDALGIAISNDTCSKQPLEGHHTCSFSVAFSPTVAGDVMTAVHVQATPGGDASATISASALTQGKVRFSESTHDFLALNIDAAALTHTFTVQNTGQTTIGGPIPTFTGSSQSYSVSLNSCGTTLAPGATCDITVTFDPTTVGSKADSLRVDSDMNGGTDIVQLSGTGTAHVHITPGGTGHGTVSSLSQAGIACGSACDYDFSTQQVTLAAVADPGSTFSAWSACSGTDNCALVLDSSKTVNATFDINFYNLTVTQLGTGGTIQRTVVPSTTGVACGTDCLAYPYQTSVMLSPTASVGWSFVGWSGDCTGTGACTVTMDQVHAVTATFRIDQHPLVVTLSGDGGGTVTGNKAGANGGIDCSGTSTGCNDLYDYNTQVTLTAAAGTGSTFASWSGCDTIIAGKCVVAMTAVKNVTAQFTLASFTVAISPAPANGAVTSTDGNINCGSLCSHAYKFGTDVTVSAQPANGYHFDHWNGGPCDASTTASCAVHVPASATTFSAVFAKNSYTLGVALTGAGTVTSDKAGPGGGIACTSNAGTCSDQYDYSTTIVLTAAPATGYMFVSWTGCDTVAANQCTVTMAGIENITARFDLASFPVTISPAPPAATGAVTSTNGDFACGSLCSHTYTFQSSVTLNAQPANGYHFDHWTGGACNGSTVAQCVVTVPAAATTLSAVFTKNNYTLTVVVGGTGTGTVSSAPAGITSCAGTCMADFPFQQSVLLTATPGAGATASWSGCDSVTANGCTISMVAAATVQLTFSAGPQTLTVSTAGNATGRVTSQPAAIDCPGTCQGAFNFNDTVVLTATPTAPAQFAGWTGACTNATGTCTVKMDQARSVIATFSASDQPLTVTRSGNGNGTLSVSSGVPATSCTGTTCTYPYGTSITVQQSPANGSLFGGWSGECTGTGASCTFTMTKARSLDGAFTLMPKRLQLATSGSGTGTIAVSPLGAPCPNIARCWDYDFHTQVMVTVTPDASSTFTGWSSNCTGSTPACVFYMDSDVTETATFTANDQPLTLTKSGTGTGTLSVTSSQQATSCNGTTCMYPYNTTITVQEAPGATSTFTGWSGECTGTGSSCSFSMTRARSLDGAFTLVKKRLQLAANGGGSGNVTVSPTGTPCTGIARCWDYDYHAQVTVYATPDASSSFVAWSPNCIGSTMPCTFFMDTDVTQTATFVQNYTLSVAINGDGSGSVSGGVINCGSNGTTQSGTCTNDYPVTTPVTTVTLTAAPSPGTLFTGWGGACSGTIPQCSVTMSQARSVTASFTKYYQLTTSVTGNGGVTSSATSGTQLGTCGAGCVQYSAGAMVSVSETPGVNAYFANWTGACAGKGNPCALVMTADLATTANFGNQNPLTVNIVGGGTVGSNDGAIWCWSVTSACSNYYDPTALVTLTAYPSPDQTFYPGTVFAGWSGACSGATTTCSVTMSQARDVTATFYYNLDLRWIGAGTLSSLGANNATGMPCTPATGYTSCRAYAPSSTVTVTPNPNPGYSLLQFTNWGPTQPLSLTMDASQFVEGSFIFGTYMKATTVVKSSNYGTSVAVSADGSTMAVGEPGENRAATGVNGTGTGTATASGAVFVYTRSGTVWTQQAYVKASNTGANDRFGTAVALSDDGSILIVGAPGEASNAVGVGGSQTNNLAGAAGAVYTFARTGTTWAQQAYVKASNTDAGDAFGQSVAIAGDGMTFAVGAPSEASNAITYTAGTSGSQADNSLSGAGALYVFARNGATWTQHYYVKAAASDAGDAFGTSVALSQDGSRLLVGAPNEASAATLGTLGGFYDNTKPGAGAAYYYRRSGTQWLMAGYVKATNTDAGDRFGASVAISGDGKTIAAGAPDEQSNATGIGPAGTDNSVLHAGAAYTYACDLTATNNACQSALYMKASNTATSFFGSSVALSGDGTSLAVGAPSETSQSVGLNGSQTTGGNQTGALYMFTHGTAWTQRAFIKPYSTNLGGDMFGMCVAQSADGTTQVVGAPYDNADQLSSGAVSIFRGGF
jgi:hypothetical protein